MKKIVWGTLAGGVFAFFFGWLIFGILLTGAMESLQTKEMASIMLPMDRMNWVFLVISQLFYGLLLAFIFVKWANVTTWIGGLKVGAIVIFLVMTGMDTYFYASTTLLSFGGMVLDVVINTVFGAIVGALIGFVIGKIR